MIEPDQSEHGAPTGLRAFLDERQIGAELRDELLGLQQADLLALFRLLRALRPSESALRETVHTCREISRRDNVPLAEILAHPDIATLFKNDCQLSRKERKRRLDEILHARLYPETTKIREDLSQTIRQLATEVGLRIVVPEKLEGDSVSITVRISGPDDAATTAEKFASLAAHPELPHLFRLLRGSL